MTDHTDDPGNIKRYHLYPRHPAVTIKLRHAQELRALEQ